MMFAADSAADAASAAAVMLDELALQRAARQTHVSYTITNTIATYSNIMTPTPG